MELSGHASHTSDVAPTVVEYLPLPHSVQALEPVLTLYFPATHAAHGPPLLPVKPPLHRHADTVLLAVGDSEFTGQSSHLEALTEYLPPSHGIHVDCDVAALVDENVPASQLVHSPSPCASLYVPGLQLAHVPLSCVKPALHVHSDCPG